MKKTFYTLMALLCLTACDRNEDEVTFENTIAFPRPCHVEYILSKVGQMSPNLKEWRMIDEIEESVESKYFNISVLTLDSLEGWNDEDLEFSTSIGNGFMPCGVYCEDSIPEVEQHIHNWAKERTKESATRTILFNFPYRLEGITSLTITANQRFNGAEIGADITDNFIIRNFSPGLFFNYEDYTAYVGGERIITVSEWLALKPLASPCMVLRLNEGIQVKNEGVMFTITMKLTDGKVLTATTSAVNIF